MSFKNNLLAAIVALSCAIVFYYAAMSDLTNILKAGACIATLGITGVLLQKLLDLEGEWGMFLLKTRKGLGLLDKIGKLNPGLWNFIADTGLVVGFGLFSVTLFRKALPKKAFLFGMLCLILFMQYVVPQASVLVPELIQMPGPSVSTQVASASLDAQSSPAAFIFYSLLSTGMQLAMLFGGAALSGALSIILNAVLILAKVGVAIYFVAAGVGSQILQTQAPGAVFIVPGLNIPFFEGILALAVLLVVHESAHGILGRIGKIPLKSAGIVLFGIIPIGAFVDPDEKKLVKTDADTQNRVLVAGSTSNMVTAVIFMLLLAGFYSIASGMNSSCTEKQIGSTYVQVYAVYTNGTAYNLLKPGMNLTAWNGVALNTIAGFENASSKAVAGDVVNISTNKGIIQVTAGVGGDIGVVAIQQEYTMVDYLRQNANPWMLFIFNFLGLGLVLNVLVGIVNLLPIPPFDGYRIVALRLSKSKLFGRSAIDLVIWVVVGAFLVNLLPYVWL